MEDRTGEKTYIIKFAAPESIYRYIHSRPDMSAAEFLRYLVRISMMTRNAEESGFSLEKVDISALTANVARLSKQLEALNNYEIGAEELKEPNQLPDASVGDILADRRGWLGRKD
jgi:hypothetical protein